MEAKTSLSQTHDTRHIRTRKDEKWPPPGEKYAVDGEKGDGSRLAGGSDRTPREAASGSPVGSSALIPGVMDAGDNARPSIPVRNNAAFSVIHSRFTPRPSVLPLSIHSSGSAGRGRARSGPDIRRSAGFTSLINAFELLHNNAVFFSISNRIPDPVPIIHQDVIVCSG